MFKSKRVKFLEGELVKTFQQIEKLQGLLKKQAEGFQETLNQRGSMADLMRESLGFPIDFAEASDDKCMPPHYLAGLPEDERKSFISDMESIYSSEKFQKVVRYMINVFGMNALYKASEEDRKNGQIAIIAFRTLMNRFEEMHREFLESKKNPDEKFDDQAILPE